MTATLTAITIFAAAVTIVCVIVLGLLAWAWGAEWWRRTRVDDPSIFWANEPKPPSERVENLGIAIGFVGLFAGTYF